MPRLDLAVALGVGVGGALVDVSSYARLTDGLSRRWGRDDAFYGVDPGTFSFVLDNSDGRFTPDNLLSPLDTTLTEGMAACVSVGGRLTGGTVRTVEPEFPGGVAAWASVRVTCDDSLGVLARTRPASVLDAIAANAGVLGMWKMNDAEGSSQALDSGPLTLPSIRLFGAAIPPIDFEFSPLEWGTETQALMGAVPYAPVTPMYELLSTARVFDYPTNSGGAYGFWFTLYAPVLTSGVAFSLRLDNGASSGPLFALGFGANGNRMQFNSGTLTSPLTVGEPYYFSVTVDVLGANIVHTFYMDGEVIATDSFAHLGATSAADLSLSNITIRGADAAVAGSYAVSRISHTLTRGPEETAKASSLIPGWLQAVEAAAPVAFGTLPALSDFASTYAGEVSGSVLDLLNDVMFTEQGDVYTTTTGTLTSPTSQIVVRERTRPATVSYTFDVENELSGAPDFIRDLTNLVSRVTVSSDVGSTIVTDSTLTARAGQASTTETVLLASDIDRRAWGEDRLQRGANTKLRIASVVVDAMTTPTDRSADLLALIPGDRVQFTGLPETILGFDTWDGWFLGASERHDIEAHAFQLHFTPVLPDTAVYDTDRYMADGELLLNGAINSAVTSISVDSTGALLDATDVPYTIQFDDEQMTVTAVAGASSPQTVTVTRGANGTTAASHADNAVLVSVPDSLYAF